MVLYVYSNKTKFGIYTTMNNRSNRFGLTVTVKMYGISSIHYLNKQQWAIKHFSRASNIEE